MQPLIDYTFFIGELNIPKAGDTAVKELLDLFIAKHEPLFLKDLLGYELFKAFTAGLDVDPIDQRWADLRDGKEYTNLSGRLDYWFGICPDTGNESMIANYIYYKWLRNNQTQSTAIGETIPTAENASVVSSTHKAVRAWNEMVDRFYDMRAFLDANIATYPEWQKQNKFFATLKYRKINTFGI